MAWSWNGIEFTVEVAFGTQPLADPTWTDISDHVREVRSIFHGKTSEESNIGPGSAVLVLDNRDRRFDPQHDAGPYYPNVKPMRRIRISATYDSITYQLFTGFVRSWGNEWSLEDGACVVEAVDSVWWLNAEPLPGSAYGQAVIALAPGMYYATQDTGRVDDLGIYDLPAAVVQRPSTGALSLTDIGVPIGQPLALSTDDVFSGTLSAQIPPSQSIEPRSVAFWFQGLGEATISYRAQARAGLDVYLAASGIRVDYSHDTDARRLTSFGGFETDARYDTDHPHHCVVTADTNNLYVYIDGHLSMTTPLVVGDTTLSGSEYRFSAGFLSSIYVSHVSFHESTIDAGEVTDLYIAGMTAYGHPIGETSGLRISRALDAAAIPGSLRDIDTGVNLQREYLPDGLDVVEYVRQVVESERGLFFTNREGVLRFLDRKAMTNGSLVTGSVFSDDSAAGSVAYDRIELDPATTDTIRNIVTVSYSDIGGITRRDTASVAEYGASRLFVDGPTLPDAVIASSIAAFELSQRAEPDIRVRLIRCKIRRSDATDTAAQIVGLFPLEVGQIVQVEITPLGVGTQIARQVQVFGVEHIIGPDQWYVSVYCAPAYDQEWFTIGSSVIGGTNSEEWLTDSDVEWLDDLDDSWSFAGDPDPILG